MRCPRSCPHDHLSSSSAVHIGLAPSLFALFVKNNYIVTEKMATAGSLINEFVSQNAIILIAGVISTVIVIAASTYFIARNYMTSEESESDGDNPETQNETSAAAAAVSTQSTTKGNESSHAVTDGNEALSRLCIL